MREMFTLLQQKNQVIIPENKISKMLIHINEKLEKTGKASVRRLKLMRNAMYRRCNKS